MQDSKPEKIRPTKLLYEVRKSVSEILDKPFNVNIERAIYRGPGPGAVFRRKTRLENETGY